MCMMNGWWKDMCEQFIAILYECLVRTYDVSYLNHDWMYDFLDQIGLRKLGSNFHGSVSKLSLFL